MGEYVEKDKYLHKVFCKICKYSLSYKGNTTNMIVHLQNHHMVEYNELTISRTSESTEPIKLPKGQLSIKESFSKLIPLSRSSPRWKSLTNAVCQFLAKDFVPIDTVTVQDSGFRNMLNVFEPRYSLPDRTTFSRHYLPALYH